MVPTPTKLQKGSNAKNTKPIDKKIGERIKNRRIELGFSQTKIAEHLGLTFQQVQKYENGKNRTSASRLYKISKLLDVPIDYFFHSSKKSEQISISKLIDGKRLEKDILDLIEIFKRIEDRKDRRVIANIIRCFLE